MGIPSVFGKRNAHNISYIGVNLGNLSPRRQRARITSIPTEGNAKYNLI